MTEEKDTFLENLMTQKESAVAALVDAQKLDRSTRMHRYLCSFLVRSIKYYTKEIEHYKRASARAGQKQDQ